MIGEVLCCCCGVCVCWLVFVEYGVMCLMFVDGFV